MLLRRNLLVIICGVIIASGAVSGTEVVKAVGDEVSFGPDNPPPASVSSITWKHIKDGETVKAIEWEDGEILTPNPRFNGITELDKKTGKITIKKLKFEHSGDYTIDISGKEQAQRFTLTVMEPVPQPEIDVDPTDSPNFMYLSCKYSEKIIWKNSAGQTLTGSKIEKGESITVEKNGNPEEFYTCTLENKAGSKTSEPVYERDIFKDQSEGGHTGWIVIVVILIVIIIITGVILYKRNKKCKELVDAKCTCIKGQYKLTESKSNGGETAGNKNTTGITIDINTGNNTTDTTTGNNTTDTTTGNNTTDTTTGITTGITTGNTIDITTGNNTTDTTSGNTIDITSGNSTVKDTLDLEEETTGASVPQEPKEKDALLKPEEKTTETETAK